MKCYHFLGSLPQLDKVGLHLAVARSVRRFHPPDLNGLHELGHEAHVGVERTERLLHSASKLGELRALTSSHGSVMYTRLALVLLHIQLHIKLDLLLIY